MFFPHLQPPPNAPNSEEASPSSILVMVPKKEGGEQRHPKLPDAIHPFPPPNGCGKGGINFYNYSRTQLCFFRTRNPRQTRPTARRRPQDQFWWCLHIFTYARPTKIPPCMPRPLYQHPRHLQSPIPPQQTNPPTPSTPGSHTGM